MTKNYENPRQKADSAWTELDNEIYYSSETFVIQVKGGGLSEEATQAEKALISAKVQIYQRGLKLVRPIIQEVKAIKNRTVKVASFAEVTPDFITDKLSEVAKFERFKEFNNSYVKINPPVNIAKTILARNGDWNFPKVAGIISTPTIRPDGSILGKVGYDRETHLILADYPSMPDIPNKPTRADAEKALLLLEDLISEFPFTDECSKSVALSALITPVVRGSMSVVPMHVINAYAPGTGKSFLLDIMAAIIIGQSCPIMAAGRTEEETEKRLGAAIIAGQQIISIDNVNGDLSGDLLCQIVERPTVNIRPLGKSELITIESGATIFATGNNIRLVGDMNRRVLICNLDAKVERPELRQFKENPLNKVLADRGKYIAAILTIIKAYIVAGKPGLAPKLASFEDWSDLVRSALIWLGKLDPVKTMENARENDPYLQNLKSVLHAIKDSIGLDIPKTAKEIVDIALRAENNICKNPELQESLTNISSDKKGFISPKDLGKWLSRNEGKIIDGLKILKKVDNNGHAAKWWVTRTAVEAVEAVDFDLKKKDELNK